MHEYNGVMHCIYCDYAKLGCWGPIFVPNYAHMPNEIVLNEWYRDLTLLRRVCLLSEIEQ